MTVRATSTDGSTADETFTLTPTDVDEVDIARPATQTAPPTPSSRTPPTTPPSASRPATDADATDDTTYSMVIDTAGCSGYFDIGSSDDGASMGPAR